MESPKIRNPSSPGDERSRGGGMDDNRPDISSASTHWARRSLNGLDCLGCCRLRQRTCSEDGAVTPYRLPGNRCGVYPFSSNAGKKKPLGKGRMGKPTFHRLGDRPIRAHRRRKSEYVHRRWPPGAAPASDHPACPWTDAPVAVARR